MAFKTTTSKSSMKGKAARAQGAAAVSIGSKSGDPLVKKMKEAKQRYNDLKKQVMRKYASKGKQAVLQSARNKK